MPAGAAVRLLADFHRFARRRLVLLWLLIGGAALAEGFGIAMLVPLLALAASADPPPLFGTLPGLGLSLSREQRFAAALAIFVIVMGLRAVLIYGRDSCIARVEADYTADMRLRTAATLADRGWAGASGIGLAGMQSLLLTEIPRCIYVAHEVQMLAATAAMLVVQILLAAILSPPLAAIALLVIAVGMAGSWRVLKQSRRRGFAISAQGEQSNSAGFRLHSGLKAALAQGTTHQFLTEYGRSLQCLAEESSGYSRDRARTRAFASIAAALAAVLLMLVGHLWLQLPFALLATALVLFARMAGPAQSVQQSLHGIAAYSPAFEMIENSVGPLRAEAHSPPGPSSLVDWNELRLEDGSYTHESSGFRLEAIDLRIRAGEWIGFSGPSGGGKTTLVDLLVGLLPLTQGRLCLDRREIGPETEAGWRRGIAYVAQNEMTFDSSVRDNLLAGGTQTADDDQLWAALQTVGLAERIRNFREGLDTRLGDRGSALSGGERQRLAIARALLRTPKLMVLDEATNALDQDSEIALLEELGALRPRPALLLIAHRQAPLALCDRLVRVDGGRVHES